MEEAERRNMAWIGDAVLALFARQWLADQSKMSFAQRTEAFVSMTSNQFLSTIGDPTQIEAQIGQIYKCEDLNAAFTWIESELLPVYQSQQKNQKKSRPGSKRS